MDKISKAALYYKLAQLEEVVEMLQEDGYGEDADLIIKVIQSIEENYGL